MFTIHIKTASHFPVSRISIKEQIERILNQRLHSDAEVSVMIVGNRLMKKLNKTYRKIDDTTDVLSFPQNDPSQEMRPFVTPPDHVLYLGDIVVSYPEAVREAGGDLMMVDDKITQLVLHGLDHLMGIHHE